MKFIGQFFIIILFSFIGEMLNKFLPFPVPAGVYGLILLFSALCLKIIKVQQIENAADFLISIMPVFFVAPCVSLVVEKDILGGNIIPITIISLISTAAVIIVTGKIADFTVKETGK